MTAAGVRSSCERSALSCRSRSNALCSDASISLNVAASALSSSLPRGSSIRRVKSPLAPISLAVHDIVRTGLNALFMIA